MNILLSNDDGYMAMGLKALDAILSEAGHRISVAAPDSEQSGKSHSFTITGRMRAVEYAPGHYHFSGTPVDCIIYSHRCSLFQEMPDIVISGINHGYNLSTDIIYSGTCAAARQAALYGMKAIAVSLEPGAPSYMFGVAAEFIRDNLPSFAAAIPEYSFMNVNIPASFNGEWRLSGIGVSSYSDTIIIAEDNGSEKILAMADSEITRGGDAGDYPVDSDVCSSGMASVSIVKCFPEIDERGMGLLS